MQVNIAYMYPMGIGMVLLKKLVPFLKRNISLFDGDHPKRFFLNRVPLCIGPRIEVFGSGPTDLFPVFP